MVFEKRHTLLELVIRRHPFHYYAADFLYQRGCHRERRAFPYVVQI